MAAANGSVTSRGNSSSSTSGLAIETYIVSLDSPLGLIEIRATTQHVSGIRFIDSAPSGVWPSPLTDNCKTQLTEYFDGQRTRFDLPLQLAGTGFQQAVWQQLLAIPFGEAISYRQLADRVGNPKATRAVGAANRVNPVVIVVPCHRVIGSDRSLTGFAGRVPLKAWLLTHEGVRFSDAVAGEDRQLGLFDG